MWPRTAWRCCASSATSSATQQLRVGEILLRHPEPAPGFAESWRQLMAEHRAATAGLCRLVSLGWLAADDAATGRVTIKWGPDGRIQQLRIKTG